MYWEYIYRNVTYRQYHVLHTANYQPRREMLYYITPFLPGSLQCSTILCMFDCIQRRNWTTPKLPLVDSRCITNHGHHGYQARHLISFCLGVEDHSLDRLIDSFIGRWLCKSFVSSRSLHFSHICARVYPTFTTFTNLYPVYTLYTFPHQVKICLHIRVTRKWPQQLHG